MHSCKGEILSVFQSRMSEQYEEMSDLLKEKEKELEEQKIKYDTDMKELRETLEKEYEAKISDIETKHKSEMDEMRTKLEAAMAKIEEAGIKQDIEAKAADSAKESDKTIKSTESVESTKTDETEKEEDQEKVTSTDSGSDKSDKDDDDKDDGKGGAKAPARGTETIDVEDKHEGTSKPADATDEPDGTGAKDESEVVETVEKQAVQKVHSAKVGEAETTEELAEEDREVEETPVDEKVEKMVVEKVEAVTTTGLDTMIVKDEEESEVVKQLREELDAKVKPITTNDMKIRVNLQKLLALLFIIYIKDILNMYSIYFNRIFSLNIYILKN